MHTRQPYPASKLILILLFIFTFAPAFAVTAVVGNNPVPKGTLSGKVEDASTHSALEYVTVILFRSADSAMVAGVATDAGGVFAFDRLEFGSYYIVLNYIGYQKETLNNIEISKEKNLVDMGTLSISTATSELQGAEVTAEREQVQYKIDKKVINVSKNITVTGGSAADALRSVPSVTVDAEGNVSIRGSANYTVLVDGRQTPQSGNDVLKQTPASAVENIEVITNPSAKYDPDGTAGIINIVMKKNRMDGINGIVNASYQTFDKYSADIQLNCRTGKFNFFGGADYRNRVDKVTQDIEKTMYINDSAFATMSDVKQSYHRSNYRLNAGADWHISKNNTLTLSGTHFRQTYDIKSPVYYHLYTAPATTETWLDYQNNMAIVHHWTQGDLYYTHTFNKPGHTLALNVVYNQWAGDKSDEQIKHETDAGWSNFIAEGEKRRRHFDNSSRRLSGDLDYTFPIKDKFRLEAGYSGDLVHFGADYRVEFYDPANELWAEDAGLSNGFTYDNSLHALYSTFGGEIRGFGFQLGIRGEYYHRNVNTHAPDTAYPMDIWSLFPTVHLSKQFPKGHQIQLSYSRRVNRPDVMALTPLPYFSDEFLVHTGNPSLRPEYGNAIELNYQKMFGQSSLSAEAYYRNTRDLITQIIKINSGQTLSTNVNMNKDWAAGIEVAGNMSIRKFLKIAASINGFRYHLEGTFGNSEDTREAYSANARLNITIILKSGTIIQMNGFYNAPGLDAAGDMRGFGSIDAAIKQEFLKKKLSLTINAGNVFGLMKYIYTDRTDAYLHEFKYLPEGNIFGITLSYKINNYIRRQHSTQNGGAMDVGF